MTRPAALALLCLALAGCGPAPAPPIAPVADLDLSGPIAPSQIAAFNEGSELADRAPAVATPCGAATKAGRPCRNRVKGGGPCWRHRAPSK